MGDVINKINQVGLLIFLAVQSRTDIREKQVSIKICAIFAGIAMVFYIFSNLPGFEAQSFFLWLGGVVPGGVLLLAARYTRESIGYGDGIVLLVSGLFLGFWGSMELLLIGLWGSAFFGIIVIAVKRVKKGYKIAFVPFLLGAYIFLLC